MKNKNLFLFIFLIIGFQSIYTQTIVEGYIFEDDNRGFVRDAKVIIEDRNGIFIKNTYSDETGKINIEIPPTEEILVKIEKNEFQPFEQRFSTFDNLINGKLYIKCKMIRKPGYIFDVTLAERIKKGDILIDAISDARVEVYNQTKKKYELQIEHLENPNFHCNFEKGNQYAILVTAKGYYAKRMEAYVNVKGCILCFDGVGDVKPGISDNLTQGFEMGTLLANVEMDKIVIGDPIIYKNVFYRGEGYKFEDTAKSDIQNIVNFVKNNPTLVVEIGSYTESKGDDYSNKIMSQKRANYLRNYLIENHKIDSNRLVSKGYGESKILNKCKNGVPCTYKEQLFNRRIELKPTGFIADSNLQTKHLDELIEEENYEQTRRELENQTVVKIPENATSSVNVNLEKNEKKQTTTPTSTPKKKIEKPILKGVSKAKSIDSIQFTKTDTMANYTNQDVMEKKLVLEKKSVSNEQIQYHLELQNQDTLTKMVSLKPQNTQIESVDTTQKLNLSMKSDNQPLNKTIVYDTIAKSPNKIIQPSTNKFISKDTTKATKKLDVTYTKLGGKKVAVITKNSTPKSVPNISDTSSIRPQGNYADKKIKVAVEGQSKSAKSNLPQNRSVSKVVKDTKLDSLSKNDNPTEKMMNIKSADTAVLPNMTKDTTTKIVTTEQIQKIAEKTPVTDNNESPYATHDELKSKKEIKPIGNNFTSYTILIIENPVALAVDENMTKYQLPILSNQKDNIFSYYIGEFKIWNDAEKYLSIIKRDFPNARIVDFYNGKEYDKK